MKKSSKEMAKMHEDMEKSMKSKKKAKAGAHNKIKAGHKVMGYGKY